MSTAQSVMDDWRQAKIVSIIRQLICAGKDVAPGNRRAREKAAMGSILCEHCTGACCRYIALPIEEPTDRRDFDDMRWYVMHKGISVFVEDDEWYIQIAADCENLQPDNMCGIYETRPAICREYDAGECDYAGGDYHYEVILRTPQDVQDYAVTKIGKQGIFDQPPRARRTGGKKVGSKGIMVGRSLASLKVLSRHD